MGRSVLLIMVIFSFWSVGGCGGSAVPAPRALHVAAPAAPVTLHPLFLRDAISAEAASLLHPQLLGTNPDTLHVEPRLFSSWDISEDNTTYTFTLRDDLFWSDGTPLTAEDVAFTLRIICHGDYTGWMYPLLQVVDGAEEYRKKRSSSDAGGSVAGITVEDDTTVVIRLKQPHAPFLTYLGFAPLPSHALADVAVAEMEAHPYARSVPIGAGPYLLVEWLPDQYLHVRANPDYYLGQPAIEEIFYRFIPNPEAQLIELMAGKLDVIPTAVKVEDVSLLAEDPNLKIHRNSRLVYDYIGMNFARTSSPLADLRVRRALSMLLSKDDLVDHLLLGYGMPLHGPLLPLHFAFDPDFSRDRESLPAARELLLQAGYPQMELKLIFNAGNVVRENVALLFKERAAQVGVNVHIHVLEWEAFLAALKEGSYDLVVLGRGADADPDLSFHWHSQGAGNTLGYANAAVDALLEEGVSMGDREKRKELYRSIQKLIVDDAPVIWLYTRQAVHAATTDLENFSAHPESLFYNVHQWTLANRRAIR